MKTSLEDNQVEEHDLRPVPVCSGTPWLVLHAGKQTKLWTSRVLVHDLTLMCVRNLYDKHLSQHLKEQLFHL